MKVHLYANFVSVAVTKYLNQNQLKEGNVYLAYNSSLQCVKAEKLERQDLETADHHIHLRAERNKCTCAAGSLPWVASFTLTQIGVQPMKWCLLYSEWIFPLQLTNNITSQRHTHWPILSYG